MKRNTHLVDSSHSRDGLKDYEVLIVARTDRIREYNAIGTPKMIMIKTTKEDEMSETKWYESESGRQGRR
jgi:hypothetical protein